MPGHVLALHVAPANAGDRAEVGCLAKAVQAATAAEAKVIDLAVVKLAEAKRGFVVLRRRWAVECSFAWTTRCRRLVKDYKRYATTLGELYFVTFAFLRLKQAALLAAIA